MNAFEKWQVVVSVTQTCILLGTLLVAVYIGLRQTEISSRQTEISLKQTEISKSLLDIPFTVSVDVVYEASTKRLNIYNKGQTNIYLWGTKLGDGPQVLEKAPVLITPGGSYYILADFLESNTLAKIPKDGELRGDFLTYITSQNATKYVITTIIFAQVTNAHCTIHTQTTSIKPQEW